ncbi:AbiJ-NTD4 domain-containing protein [Weissella paramesenteroides]
MSLYSERHGKRLPKISTYNISEDAYALLLNLCSRYRKNLTEKFPKENYDGFTGERYIDFDENTYDKDIHFRIPNLFRNEAGLIVPPQIMDNYDQFALLDLIEFYAKNIRDIDEDWNNQKYKNYRYVIVHNTARVFKTFQNEVNDLFTEIGLLYILTDKKIIERKIKDGVIADSIDNEISMVPEDGLRSLLEDAVALYRTPNNSARQDSVEKIWDAFERLKSYYKDLDKRRSVIKILEAMSHKNAKFYEMFDSEFTDLTRIGNKFRIRHHERNQQDITDPNYYDYLFSRCLSLVTLAIKYLEDDIQKGR